MAAAAVLGWLLGSARCVEAEAAEAAEAPEEAAAEPAEEEAAAAEVEAAPEEEARARRAAPLPRLVPLSCARSHADTRSALCAGGGEAARGGESRLVFPEPARSHPACQIKTSPFDPRFPTMNQAKNCFTRYNEFHKRV